MYKRKMYELCEEIVEKNTAFKKKINIIDGYTITQYNYHLAQYNDFIKPLKDKEENGLELRGLTFVESPNGDLEQYLMLNKFFNVNEVITTQLHEIVNKKIIRIQDKLDGSMIRFIKIGDKIIAKTKYSLESEQAIAANELLKEDKNFKNFVLETLDNRLCAIFEYISPFNKIVCDYKDSELKLLQLRDEETGEYLDIYNNELVKKYNIKTTVSVSLNTTLQELVDLSGLNDKIDPELFIKGIEGWVITFEDQQMVKLKTQWYWDLHKLVTDSISKENYILKYVLEDTIDDVLAQIPEEHKEKKDWVIDISTKIAHYVNNNAKECFEIVRDKYNGNKKDFAIEYKEHELFGVLMSLTKENTLEKSEELISKVLMTRYLNKYELCKEWVNSI